MSTAEQLTRRLERIYSWYGGMIRRDTGLLEYLYLPDSDTFVQERSPIREIASVRDVAEIGEKLQRDELRPLVQTGVRHFAEYLVEANGSLILDANRLGEPSTIAHSAFMILALLQAPPPRRIREAAALAEGILRQQRPDGSFAVFFDGRPDQGEELYAGEAMLALITLYRELQEKRCLLAVEKGFTYYDARYFQKDRVDDDVLVFFANWQSRACRPLFESTRNVTLRPAVADFVYRMHDRIIERGFYDAIEADPGRQSAVEVACALEGLNEAYALARDSGDRAELYRRCICKGLTYLLALQCIRAGTARERGGFGMSLGNRSQRIDVTGHAASAFIETLANRIECGTVTH